MFKMSFGICFLVVIQGFCESCIGQEDGVATEIVERSLKAIGGKRHQERFAQREVVMKGTFKDESGTFPMVKTAISRLPGYNRTVEEVTIDGEKLQAISVFSQPFAWKVVDGMPEKMDETAVKACWEATIISEAKLLYPLLEQGRFKLRMGERKTIESVECDCVIVSVSSVPDSYFYFSRTDYLLRAIHCIDKQRGFEGSLQTLLSDYREFNGAWFPTTIRGVRTNGLVADMKLISITPLEQIDRSFFEVPKSIAQDQN